MTQYPDLCSTCMHASDCINKGKSDRYIYYCEEFEIAPADTREPQKVVSEQQGEKHEDQNSSFKGLCVNCENRNTCNLSTVPGGVWHCEEYL